MKGRVLGVRLFSDKKRAVHLGPFPVEGLLRGEMPDLASVPRDQDVEFASDTPGSLLNAMRDYQAMMDALRDGLINKTKSEIPSDISERSRHLKAFGYFNDASMVGIGPLPGSALRECAIRNPDIDRLAHDLSTKQTKTLASGIDMIMADLKDSMSAPPTEINAHSWSLVILNEAPRTPWDGEPGTEWLAGASQPVAALRAAETAVVLANYIRLLGWEARAHTVTSSDVHLGRLGMAAGLLMAGENGLEAPFLEAGYGLAAVTTDLPLAQDKPLVAKAQQPRSRTSGPSWWLGATGARRTGLNGDPFKTRAFHKGPHPFEKLKRVEKPTTYIDEPNVARVPKRTDMFARAQFGDMGPALQNGAKGGHYARKAAPSSAQRRLLGAFVLLQDGPTKSPPEQKDAAQNALAIKAASYFLGVDAVGISRCPEWAWYSHDATGAPIEPTHDQAISMIVDQGYETMEGASGDDWVSGAQSMRAYMRGAQIAGIVADHIRSLGYGARSQTNRSSDVLHIPLVLHAGLGELSRIGELVLNPFVGPRFKSVVVTTDMPITPDRHLDFGLQDFCGKCTKCARECPCGAISFGDKIMFNGAEMWKPDVEKCTKYRVGNLKGAACGRCMKTCPYNIEGVLAERAFLWAAIKLPFTRRFIATLDDKVGNGSINRTKKWWWDLEWRDGRADRPAKGTNARDLDLNGGRIADKQKVAIYPADVLPPGDAIGVPVKLMRKEAVERGRRAETPAAARNRVTPPPKS